ncbi:hypothetical protein [Planctomycetes bacterium TBK1r]|uniref:Transposase IS116/IS110/IS902 family protein n=1 Tax=Stieleria magnilauensis TaxID=2527963 RepID=A0ABX5XJ17_9BACT|nr:hypothetical protein TBK1r_02800 [Planctomycetes bacterium TBK1r]
MHGLDMGQENGERIESAEEMLALFYAQLVPKVTLWKQRISDHPEQLATLERTIHDAFARGADMVVAGLISATMIEEGLEKACQSSRGNFSRPLQKGRETRVAVRLLGGMLFWATTLYCAPKKKLLAVHHVSKALASLGLDADIRQGLYRQYRTLLRNGQWRRVVDELAGLERVGKSATECHRRN